MQLLFWCRQTVPNLLWVFRSLTATPSSWRVSNGDHVTDHHLQASSPPPPFYTKANKRLSLLPLLSCTQLSYGLCLITPSVVSTNHKDSAVNPLHPTSTGNIHACHPFSLHSMVFQTLPLMGLITAFFPWDSQFHKDNDLCLLWPGDYDCLSKYPMLPW